MKAKWFIPVGTLTILAVAISGGFSGFEKISNAQLQPTPPESLLKALEDAALPESHEVLNNLTVINRSNPNLTWDNQGRVLVATFTRKDRFEEGEQIKSNNHSDPLIIWVTVVPKLKNFCTDYVQANSEVNTRKLNERLEQLLGIKSNSQNTHVAKIWVDPQYLKRPAIDPEIDDSIAELPPPSHEICQDQNGDCDPYQKWLKKQLEEQEGNREYFQNLRNNPTLVSQALPNLYPWTGLGYTYDWGIYPKTPLQTDAGLSEFIIFLPPNTEPSVSIEVKGVFSTEEYCKKE
jgi:hypothetical protein